MKQMDEEALQKQLESEGFSRTYAWKDEPNAFYPEHTHPMETAHVVLDGELTLTMNGITRVYHAGERCDVPSGAVHSARMGAKGCRYVIGER